MSLKKCSLKGCVMENETSRHGAEGINGPQYHAQCAVIALRTERELADRLAENLRFTREQLSKHGIAWNVSVEEVLKQYREARGTCKKQVDQHYHQGYADCGAPMPCERHAMKGL